MGLELGSRKQGRSGSIGGASWFNLIYFVFDRFSDFALLLALFLLFSFRLLYFFLRSVMGELLVQYNVLINAISIIHRAELPTTRAPHILTPQRTATDNTFYRIRYSRYHTVLSISLDTHQTLNASLIHK